VATDLCGFVLGSWCAFFPIVLLLVVVLSSVFVLIVLVVLFPFCGGSLHCFVRRWWLLVAL